ncbi:MAG: glycosyltransferase [Abditibacteriota bacterium]|nr:glycosyltransferase [Abditibacteriota bacterium]
MQSAGSDQLTSVVIPVFIRTEEQLGWLREAVASALGQSHDNIQLILADDMSPVSIRSILCALPKNTVYFRNSQNLGQAGCRQKAVETARGGIVAFLDQDDLWEPDYLREQLRYMEERQADMVFCDPEFLVMDGADSPVLRQDRSKIPERSSFLSLFLQGNYAVSFSGTVIKKQAILEAGGMDARYTSMDDFDLYLKISSRGSVLHNPQTLYRYRIHTSAANRRVRLFSDSLLLMRLYLRHFAEAGAGEKKAMLPRLVKKTLALAYYKLCNK